MGMPHLTDPTYWTADMVQVIPEDGNRYEVVHGELLVTPAPGMRHQEIVGRLAFALTGWLRSGRLGRQYCAPADIRGGPGTLVQPDLFVVSLEAARAGEWPAISELLLAIEVLSPSTARYDRFAKRRRYQEAGVPVYWIVDAELRQVEVWTPADVFPAIERDRLRWQPPGSPEAFELSLPELFRSE